MFEVAITNRFSPALQRVAEDLASSERLFKAIDRGVVTDTQRQLRRNENRSRWAPLKPRYEAFKRRRVGQQPILIFTGSLADRYLQAGQIEKDAYKFGLNDTIALTHHHGDPRRGVPPRPLNYAFAAKLALRELVSDVRKVIVTRGLGR